MQLTPRARAHDGNEIVRWGTSTTRQALLILFNIPLALVGGVLILLLSGLYLSVPASIGFIALLGIAIQNGVVLVVTGGVFTSTARTLVLLPALYSWLESRRGSAGGGSAA